MNDGSKEPQEQDNYSTSSSENKWLILSFCGGAYQKFRVRNQVLWRCMRDEIIKRNNQIIYISGMVEFLMFISVHTIPLLEFVTRDLEDVPCWTI